MKRIEQMEQELLQAKQVNYDNRETFPPKPGCYLIREKGVIRYIGETRNLRARMMESKRTYNHTLKSYIGKQLFGRWEGGRTRYSDDEEEKINNYLSKHVTIAFLIVNFGRKELEEQMVKNYRNVLFNKISRR